MGGSRHSKNAAGMGSEGLNYHERRAMHFGTQTERLGKDSLRAFDHCGLTLQPAKDPVVTPDGIVYSREVILENLLKQKKAIGREVKAWEEQEKERAADDVTKEGETRAAALAQFHSQNHGAGKWEDVDEAGVVAGTSSAGEGTVATAAGTDFERKQRKEMKAYWLPSFTPDVKKTVNKPDSASKCPCTGKNLRMKELVSIKWTPAPKDAGGDAAYMCPLCKKCFGASARICVLKPTGDALCGDCCTNFVEKDGNYNGKSIRKKDVIALQRSGTGFIASGTQIQAKRFEHLGVGSGAADVRGQSAGASSKFGLVYR